MSVESFPLQWPEGWAREAISGETGYARSSRDSYLQASVLVGRPCPVPEYITELLARAREAGAV